MATLDEPSSDELGVVLAAAIVVYALLLLALGAKELHELNQHLREQREARRDEPVVVSGGEVSNDG